MQPAIPRHVLLSPSGTVPPTATAAAHTAVHGTGTVPQDEASPTTQSRPISRMHYLDWLRVFLLVFVAFNHSVWVGVLKASGSPAYGGVHTPSPDVVSFVIGSYLLGASLAYNMGLFYLRAGYFSVPSYNKKGPVRFLKDRAMRLLLPLAVWELFLYPVLLCIGSGEAFGSMFRSYFSSYASIAHLQMWFVCVLFIFDLLYVALRCCKAAVAALAERWPARMAGPTCLRGHCVAAQHIINDVSLWKSCCVSVAPGRMATVGNISKAAGLTNNDDMIAALPSGLDPGKAFKGFSNMKFGHAADIAGTKCAISKPSAYGTKDVGMPSAAAAGMAGACQHEPFSTSFMICAMTILVLVLTVVMFIPQVFIGTTWNELGILFQYNMIGQYAICHCLGAFMYPSKAFHRLPTRLGYVCLGAGVAIYSMACFGLALFRATGQPGFPGLLHAPTAAVEGTGILSGRVKTGLLLYASTIPWHLFDCMVTQLWAVLFSIGLLVLFRQRCDCKPGRFGQVLVNASYSFYILFPLVLVSVARGLENVQLHPWVFVAIVWPVTVVGGYVVAIAVRAVPGAGRVL